AADGMTLVTQNIIPDGSDAFGLTVSTDGDRLIFIYAKQNNGVKDPYLRSRVYRTSTSEWGDERVVGEVQAGHTLTRMTSTDRVLSARSVLIDTIEVDDSDSTVDIRSFLFDADPEASSDQQLAETFVAAFKADAELASLPDLISRRVNLDEPNSVATAAAVSAGASAAAANSSASAANTAATAAQAAAARSAAAFGYALTIDAAGNLVLLLPPDVAPNSVTYRLSRVSDGAFYHWGIEDFTALPISDWSLVSAGGNLPLIEGTPPGDRLRIGVLPGVDGPFEFSVVDSGVAEGSELAAWTLGYTVSSGAYTLPSQGFRAADQYSVDAVQVDTTAVVGKLPEDEIAGASSVAAIGAQVSAENVSSKRTWRITERGEGYQAPNFVTVQDGFAGTLQFDLSNTTIATLTGTPTVTITGPASVTATEIRLRASDRMAVLFDVPTLATVGTYTVKVTANTSDSQTIPVEGTLSVK
ncbi:MAG: hypothetical protein AAGF31_13250, partial [Planctomycetota bacterium]